MGFFSSVMESPVFPCPVSPMFSFLFLFFSPIIFFSFSAFSFMSFSFEELLSSDFVHRGNLPEEDELREGGGKEKRRITYIAADEMLTSPTWLGLVSILDGTGARRCLDVVGHRISGRRHRRPRRAR